jgi:uncharacterized protein (TIGR02646 family)
MICRLKSDALNKLNSLSEDKILEFKTLAVKGVLEWSSSNEEYRSLIELFKKEIKDYYYFAQGRRCCYCSIELQNHKATYDVEHILSKDEYPEYMFDSKNMAVACKVCNSHKSNKKITSCADKLVSLSDDSNDYLIVHPHLDEWSEHFLFDAVNRIKVKDNSEKGEKTFSICKMNLINLARLADGFNFKQRDSVEKILRKFLEEDNSERKREILDLLRELSGNSKNKYSYVVINALESDLKSSG